MQIGFGLFFFMFFGLALASTVLWIMAIVEIVRVPDYQFRAARTDKTLWVVVVVIGGIVGAIVWYAAKRAEVLRMAGAVPISPPGWYPDPMTGGWHWWDGVRWIDPGQFPPATDTRSPPAGP